MQHKPKACVGALTASLDELMPLMQERLAAGQAIRFYPRGVSMRPLIREGKDSVVLCAPSEPLKLYDIALFHSGERYILHRVVAREQGKYVFCGDARRAYEAGIEDGQIIAVVTSVCRDGREIGRESDLYLAYARRAARRRRVWSLLARVKRLFVRLWRR